MFGNLWTEVNYILTLLVRVDKKTTLHSVHINPALNDVIKSLRATLPDETFTGDFAS
jgi:hypothetical protein